MTADQATQAVTWFDAFIKHGSAVSVLLSLCFGWGFSLFMRFPLHKLIAADDVATYAARVCCVAGSFAITLITWPNEYRLAWALTMGVMSPLLGMAALYFLGKWKPDLVAGALSMKKTTTEE